jgi:hypothetical protein
MTDNNEEQQYDLLLHHHQRFGDHIEGTGPVNAEYLVKTCSILDDLILILVEKTDMRPKRYDQIRYWLRTIIDSWFLLSFILIIVLFST